MNRVAAAARWPVERLIRSQVAGPLLILALVFVAASVTTDRFLNSSNLRNVGLSLAIVAIIAIGSTLVILTAQIDLSPGAVVALTSMTTAVLLHNEGVALVPTFGIILLLGAAVGLINGFFASYGRIPSFILTLGTMSVFQGIAYLETGGTPIFSLSPVLNDIFYGTVVGITNPFIFVVVLYALAWAYLRYTRGGREIYAVGGNETAARLAGVKVNRVRTKVFVLAGLLSALGGLLMSAQLDSGSPDYGHGMELTAIAAAVIGGTSLFGGQGNVITTLFGAMIITIVQNVLNLNAVGTAWQNISLGVIIALAVGADMWRGSITRGALAQWGRISSRPRPPGAPGGGPGVDDAVDTSGTSGPRERVGLGA
jgi:ribose transport system permease protein